MLLRRGDDEINDRRRVVQTVRVGVDARFADDFDGSAHRLVAAFDYKRVFFRGHDRVGIAHDVDQRDVRRGERSESVDRVAFPGHCRRFALETVQFLQGDPVVRAAFAGSFAGSLAGSSVLACVLAGFCAGPGVFVLAFARVVAPKHDTCSLNKPNFGVCAFNNLLITDWVSFSETLPVKAFIPTYAL